METRPMRLLRNLGRMRQIVSVLLNHGFGDLVERLNLGASVRWGRRVLLKRREPQLPLSRAQRIRMSLEELGPTFVKFGQMVSTRPDLLPDDILDELKRLCEHVPPFPTDEAIAIVERELGRPLSEAFQYFDRTVIGGGSLAQVHKATLPDGTIVAVKILRPGIVDDIERDLALMEELATLMDRYMPEARVFDPIGLVNHFSRSVRRELNLTREARTLDEFRRLYRNDATLKVPLVFPSHSSSAVLTMEFVDGMKVDDRDELRRRGLNCRLLAENGARIFLKQAFELGIFHGDPHPGNLRVLPDGSLCLLDYGMIGLLDERMRDLLIDLLLAVIRRDETRAVRVVEELGRPAGDVDRALLQADLRDFIDNYYGVELSRLNVGNLLTDFIRILVSHEIRCPGDLMLLIRALITLEGVGRNLSPDFNLASVLQPFVERAVRQRFSPSRITSDLFREVRTLGSVAHRVPVALARTLDKLSNDDLRIELDHRHIEKLIVELDRSSNRVVIGLILAALIVASALVLRSGFDSYWLSVPVYVVSSMLGIWLIYGVFRSGRL